MDWPTRARIALGVARALAYIHHCCEPRIVHRDVSATNVLLDEDFEPRLSDFGLARLLDNNDTHVTVTVAGTFGYVSPGMALDSRPIDQDLTGLSNYFPTPIYAACACSNIAYSVL